MSISIETSPTYQLISFKIHKDYFERIVGGSRVQNYSFGLWEFKKTPLASDANKLNNALYNYLKSYNFATAF